MSIRTVVPSTHTVCGMRQTRSLCWELDFCLGGDPGEVGHGRGTNSQIASPRTSRSSIMKRFRLRFGLLSLLALPAMFELGWWARDRNYERDVYAAAEKVAVDAGGIFIPELGIIHGGKELSNRMGSMTPQARAEIQRRLAYDEDVVAPTFDPPRPGFLESLKSLFGCGQNNDSCGHVSAKPEDAGHGEPSEQHPEAKDIGRRIEFLRQSRGASEGTPPSANTLPPGAKPGTEE